MEPSSPRIPLRTIGLAATACLLGCPGNVGGPPGPCDSTYALLAHLRIDQVLHPSPVLAGSRLAVRGESFIPERLCVAPEVLLSGTSSAGTREVRLTVEVGGTNDLAATVTSDAAALLGPGAFDGALIVRFRAVDGSALFETSASLGFQLVSELTPRIQSVGQATVYLNDPVVVSGADFIGGDEGVTEVVVDGTFRPRGGGPDREVSGLRLPATWLEVADRTRATFLWSPLLGGLSPGRFEGTLTPYNVHSGGARTSGAPLALVLEQEETFLIDIRPEVVSLGQVADIVGRGFIGAPEGTTSIRLVGDFTPHRGLPEPVSVELVGTWVRGDLVHYTVTVSNEGGYLHAIDFGAHRGEFTGQAFPVLTMGRERWEGRPVEVDLTLGPVRQVAWVRFLPGFADSLELFGLGGAVAAVRDRVLERMQEIYCPADDRSRCINVEFRAEHPDDFYAGGYAIIDIGGRDPNGYGLFGYDNTPGKDVGNLRLHDHVGGENALGALDGFGYGGVFIESMLFWSHHPPDVLGSRPAAAPPPDERFDAAFDPLREREVVAGEFPTGASPSRLAEIERAVWFLSSMVADTAAHEFGHSLGLAQPYGSPTEYHNAIPRDGCLMDAGRDRPLEERARLDGNPGARFCGENFFYLQDILPVD